MTEASQPAPPMGGRVRWSMIWLSFGAVTINYVDRANLGVALPYMTDEMHLSKTATGLLLGAFFWTYAAFLPGAGWLVDRFGPRRMMAFALLAWSAATMLVGAASGFLVLLLVRLLLGAVESPCSAQVGSSAAANLSAIVWCVVAALWPRRRVARQALVGW